MSDVYVPSFFSDDPRGGALTFEQLQARRKIAAALATRNRGFPKNIGEGLTYLGESLGEMIGDQRMAAGEARYAKESRDRIQRLLDPATTPAPAAAPAAPAPPNDGPGPMSPDIDPFGGAVSQAPPGAVERAPAGAQRMALAPDIEQQAPAGATTSRQPLTPAQAARQPSMSIEEWMQRIARNESGGRKDAYTLIGERSRRGDYPYGKYQVMGENIPVWTQGYLGRKMTPKEFLNDPEAQEQLARAKGGEYMTKYGPNGAAAAWFAGEKGMNDPTRKDALGTHVAEYGRRFNTPLVSREQVVASAAPRERASFAFAPGDDEEQPPVQLASMGGAPTPNTVPGQRPGRMMSDPLEETPEIRDAMARTLAQQSPMQPQPAPQQQQPLPQQRLVQQLPIGTPVPSSVRPPPGPPREPDPVPVSPREMAIRRAAAATRDPNEAGQLQAVAEQMAEQRKFENARNVEKWKNDLTTYQQRTDPVRQEQLQKSQEERAAKARELEDERRRGGVSQSVIDKGVEASAKVAMPLREASVGINQIEGLLEKGMFTGTLGKVELAIAKGKAAVGFAADPRIATTEQFTSSVKPIVAAARAALAGGANISDRDMQAAEQAAGGDITLTKEGITSIMASIRTVQMQTAMHHQKLLSTAAGGNPAAESTLYSLYGLPMENIIPKGHPAVQRLMQNADNEHERGMFDKAWHTPGLASKIILRNRPQ